MNKWQCPICNSARVTSVGETMMCLGCGHREYLYDYRNAYDQPMGTLPTPDITDLEDRINTLEAISARPGGMPRQYHEQFQQVKGEIANLRNKVEERAANRKAPATSGYKGLTV